jgi:hypothetical protein
MAIIQRHGDVKLKHIVNSFLLDDSADRHTVFLVVLTNQVTDSEGGQI